MPDLARAQLLQDDAFAKHPVPAWAQPYLDFLIQGVLPKDEVHARKIQCRIKAYTIINNRLYKRSAGGAYLRCIEPDLGHQLLESIHKGECGHHASTRATASKAVRYGFFWPTISADAEKMIKACNGCQHFRTQKHTPSAALRTIPITWPFAVWGLDMVGPFKTARSGMTHLLVAVDKFTKWIEAKPIKKLDGYTVITFFTDKIGRAHV